MQTNEVYNGETVKQQESMKTYFILSIIFSVVFILTLAFAVVVPTQFIYNIDCTEIVVTVKTIYNNKSVDIRMEVEEEEYEAVFTLPPTYEMTLFMREIQDVQKADDYYSVKLLVSIKKSDLRRLDDRPRQSISVRQLVDVEDGYVILSYEDTNDADQQTLIGIKILLTCFAGCALVVCIYHTFRTRPRVQRPDAETIEND